MINQTTATASEAETELQARNSATIAAQNESEQQNTERYQKKNIFHRRAVSADKTAPQAMHRWATFLRPIAKLESPAP